MGWAGRTHPLASPCTGDIFNAAKSHPLYPLVPYFSLLFLPTLPTPLQALLLSSLARRDSTTGEIVNLMAIDAQRFLDVVVNLHTMWVAPLQIVLSLFFLYNTIGPSVFAGVAVMILLLPVNAVIMYFTRKLVVKSLLKYAMQFSINGGWCGVNSTLSNFSEGHC